jgi:hypothetical protein
MRQFLALFGARFLSASWSPWLSILDATFGETPADPDLVRRVTGRTSLPTEPVRELWAVVGRRGGKSQIAALIAIFLSCFRTYELAPGEVGTLMLLAADRKQARVVKRYIVGLMRSVPALALLIANEKQDAIELTNGINIEIHTSNFKNVRGYTVIGAICDEIAFWQNEDSANPDAEIIAALRPSMLTVPGALLVAISSPYAQRGELFRNHQEHFGKDGDPILVIQADTRTMNPLVPEADIRKAYELDDARAAAEFGAQFRRDIEGLIAREALDAVIVPGRRELPRVPRVTYRGFVDFAGGSGGGDSAAFAVAHTEEGRQVLDCVREYKPPFSPANVCAEIATLAKAYGLSTITADKWGSMFVVEGMRPHAIRVVQNAKPKSALYLDLLPLVNSQLVELLDHPRLRAQALSLERRAGRGPENVDAAHGAPEDVINAAAGALVMGIGQSDGSQYRIRSGYALMHEPNPAEVERLRVARELGIKIFTEDTRRDDGRDPTPDEMTQFLRELERAL